MPHCETVTMTYRLSSVKRRQFYSIPVVLNDRVERSGGGGQVKILMSRPTVREIVNDIIRGINNLWLRAKLTYSTYCSRSPGRSLRPDVSPDVNCKRAQGIARELQFPLIVTARIIRLSSDKRKRRPSSAYILYLCSHVFYAFSDHTCGRTNESLTFPVNCGFMVYRRTAETFYCPAMRDNAALTAECPRPK